MSALTKIRISVDVSGLGNGISVKDVWEDGTAPDVALHTPYQTQETADSEEALNIGGVDTIRGIMLRAISGDIAVDTSFDTTFHSDILVREGQSAFFVPTGEVYIFNNSAGEVVIFEFVVLGSQD